MKQVIRSEPGKSILTATVVGRIIECLRSGIHALLALHERPFLHGIVLDPVDGKTVLFDGPLGGAVKDYAKDYRAIAIKKAQVSARTGLDLSEVQNKAAFLLTEGDVIYPQGSVNCHGLVVATSGAQGPVDEAVSRMIAAQLLAYCQVYLQKLQAESSKGGPWQVPGK